MDLGEFLLERIAEDEAVARAARFNNGKWHRTGEFAGETAVARDFGPDVVPTQVGSLAWDNNAHIARHDPARVLAECEAKRGIVESYNSPDSVGSYVDGLWEALAHLAVPYADHPDYREEWRP